jgi:hypothetical protein
MQQSRRKRRKARGWKLGSPSQLLGLSREEELFIELRLKLAEGLKAPSSQRDVASQPRKGSQIEPIPRRQDGSRRPHRFYRPSHQVHPRAGRLQQRSRRHHCAPVTSSGTDGYQADLVSKLGLNQKSLARSAPADRRNGSRHPGLGRSVEAQRNGFTAVRKVSNDPRHWTKIGAAFPHKEGTGFSVVHAFPVDGRLVVLPPDPAEGGNKYLDSRDFRRPQGSPFLPSVKVWQPGPGQVGTKLEVEGCEVAARKHHELDGVSTVAVDDKCY